MIRILVLIGVLLSTSILDGYRIYYLLMQGNRNYSKENYPNAVIYYTKVLDIDSSNTVARFNLGNSFYNQGSFQSAIREYQRFINITSDSSQKCNAWYNLGNACLRRYFLENEKEKMEKWIDQAISAYSMSLKFNPAERNARYNLSYAYRLKQTSKNENKNTEKKSGVQKIMTGVSRSEAEEILKALKTKEKVTLSEVMRQNPRKAQDKEKNW